jgi:hypothetical protein
MEWRSIRKVRCFFLGYGCRFGFVALLGYLRRFGSGNKEANRVRLASQIQSLVPQHCKCSGAGCELFESQHPSAAPSGELIVKIFV